MGTLGILLFLGACLSHDDEDNPFRHLYFRKTDRYWDGSESSWKHETKNIDAFQCAEACTKELQCQSFSHCEYEEAHCTLMNTYFHESHPGGHEKHENITLDSNAKCNTFVPKCWIRFSSKEWTEDHPFHIQVYKDSTPDIQGADYTSFKIKESCNVMFYESTNYGGPGVEFGTGQPVAEMDKFKSFSLYEKSGWGKWRTENKEMYWLFVLGMTWIGGAILCCIACAICPKCAT